MTNYVCTYKEFDYITLNEGERDKNRIDKKKDSKVDN